MGLDACALWLSIGQNQPPTQPHTTTDTPTTQPSSIHHRLLLNMNGVPFLRILCHNDNDDINYLKKENLLIFLRCMRDRSLMLIIKSFDLRLKGLKEN